MKHILLHRSICHVLVLFHGVAAPVLISSWAAQAHAKSPSLWSKDAPTLDSADDWVEFAPFGWTARSPRQAIPQWATTPLRDAASAFDAAAVVGPYTWTGGAGTNDWSQASNWAGGRPSNDGTVAVIFDGNAFEGTARANSNVNGGYWVYSLEFDGAKTFQFTSDNNLALGIGSGGIIQNSAAAQDFYCDLSLLSDQSWRYAAGAGAVNIHNTLAVINNASLSFGASGTITADNVQLGRTFSSSSRSKGTINQTNGLVIVGTLNIGDTDFSGIGGFASDGTYNLYGGTLAVGQVRGPGNMVGQVPTFYSGKASLKISYATLRATADSTDFVDGLTKFQVISEGTIDTNGFNVTVPQTIGDSLRDYDPGEFGQGGTLIKVGAGVLTLSAPSTYLGDTKIKAGTLTASNNGRACNRLVWIDSGAALALENTSTSASIFQAYIELNGSGTLRKIGAGAVELGGNGGNVYVRLNAGALIDVQAGILRGSNSGQGNYTNNLAGLNIAAGATFDGVEGSIRVDALTGAGTLQGGYGRYGSVTIGVANGGGTFSGALQDSGNQDGKLTLIKTGSGIQIFTGAGSYTGATTVNGGTLRINNNPSAVPPTAGRLENTSALTINNGGTLQLSGDAAVTDRLNNSAPITINDGGRLALNNLSEGASAADLPPGVGALTLNAGSTIDFGSGSNGNTLLAASLAVDGSGTISIVRWTGLAMGDNGSLGSDRLLFVADPQLSAEQLAQFQFSGIGNGFDSGAGIIRYNGYYELVPVPEPTTWVGAALCVGAFALALRRKLSPRASRAP